MEVDVCDRGASEGSLPVGELVEVRQPGTGTWYPAKVVEVKPDFRVVEYEKGSKDGLVESIPFGRNLNEPCSSGSLTVEDYSRMRPRPPPCLSMCPRNWKKGLWVDAYGDAWQEGVLIEEPGNFSTHVQVFFPDEGEKRQYCLDRLRISQLWNEEANRWSVKGQQESSQWLFETENKHLKPQRTYQRKRKRKGILDIMKSSESQEREEADETLSKWMTVMEKKRPKQTESVGDGLVSVDRNLVKVETTESDPQVEAIQEILAGDEPQSLELENVVADGTPQELTRSGELVSSAKQSFEVKAPIIGDLDVESTQEVEGADEKAGNGLGGVFQSDMDPGNTESPPTRTDIPVCYMNTQSEDLLFIEEQRPAEVNFDDQNAEDVSIDEDGSLVDDSMGMFPEKALCTLDNSSQSSLHSSQTCKETDDMQKNKMLTIPRASRKREKSPNDYQYTPYRRDDTLKEARRRAIKNLEDSGWKKGFRSRQRENRISMEAYYVAPDGTSYHSLTSACTAWMQQNKHVAKVVKDAMRSYQLQIIVRRKFSDRSLTEPSDLDDGVDDGSRKRKLRSTKRQEALKKSKKNENVVQDKLKKGRPRTECRLEALLSTPARGKQDGGTEKGLKRTTIFSWLIDLGIVTENETVSYLNKDTHVTSKGLVTRDGVLCKCCNDVFTLTNFQIHAGNKVHRTAAQIVLEDGRSILDCQRQALKKLEDAKSEERVDEPVIMDESDECCGLCAEGGELICCDHCPATFHLHCVLLKCLPEGDWFCPKCRCPVCGASQFDGRDVHFCNQCERSYHVECVNDGGIPHEESWFCSQKCYKIFCGLRALIGITNPMDGGFTWTLLRSAEHDYNVQHQADTESIAEHSSKLALALAVMKECFSPMIDPRRKIDIIAHILKNRSSDLKRLDFRGFYALLLENKDELISVASIRVHGPDIAEMPLIGTRLQYRRQGMCRRLMDVIEQVLRSLEVDTLILPAVPELQETWIGAFGFQNITSFQSVRLLELNVVGFPGTRVLHKPLTWLNLCRRIAPPLAEKPWSPGSLLNMGVDPQPQKKPKQQKVTVAAVAEDVSKDNQYAQMQEVGQKCPAIKTEKDEVPAPKEDSTEDSKIFVAKTRSNRLVKASQRVAEALKTLSSHKKFYGVESDTALQSEDSLDLDNTSELSFLKLGSSQLVVDNGKPVPAVSTSIKEILELGTTSKASSNNEIREPQETTSGMASKEIVELKGASAVVGIFDSRAEQVVQSKSKPCSSMLKKCGHCGTTETPMWRKGPVNSASLCNACGIRFRKRLFCS